MKGLIYMALTITKDNFNELVINSKKPVLVDFWATWCGPCKMLSPVVEEVAAENDSFVLGKVNVDENMELALNFKVSAIPMLILFKDGKVVDKKVGFVGKEEIEAMVK